MKLFFTHLLLSCCTLVFAQSTPYKANEWLLALDQDIQPGDIFSETGSLSAYRSQLKEYRQVSRNLNVWHLRTDPAVPEDDFARALAAHRLVRTLQRNHVGAYRDGLIPSDPEFNRQWHHANDGTSGVAGADVSTPAAWNITTGGLTATGDTIVVAVVDIGFDLEHPDLVGNIWINHAEIPDNGIDDDGNGYIDDIYGWNATERNPHFPAFGTHGTHVSGMIGARGDNGVGVTGINWNIKIMHIQLDWVIEADILEAYDYILTQRKLYNESGGAAGSFVVATNSSWGVDFGQPSDAPLWCAFYDSLGHAGILSAASTANANTNVDISGDLPTACESEFLISVTSSDASDNKSFAAFGATTIDLAAPGENVYLPIRNNRYGAVTGTSFASPLVAGMIGLMYSAPCDGFMATVKEDPAAAARLIKEIILGTVDQKPSFANRTVSGGRANVFAAVDGLMAICSACPAPAAPVLTDFTTERLTVSWEQDELYSGYELLYRVAGEPDWITIENAVSPFPIQGLQLCTEYEIALTGICGTEKSLLSEIFVTRTDGCCEAPRVIDTLFTQPNAARIEWREVIPATEYLVEYKSADSLTWLQTSSTITQVLLRDLRFCTDYEVRIASVCGTDTTGYSDVFVFRTKGCGACTEKVYCTPANGSAQTLQITGISLGGLENSSLAGAGGYESFTDGPGAELEVAGTYGFTLQLDSEERPYPPVSLRIWIDYNHDAIFDEDNETAFQRDSVQTNGTFSGTITIPVTARQGTTRMRIALWDADLNQDNLLPCFGGPYFGEYEDYCASIVQQDCPETPRLDTVSVSFADATIGWEKVDKALSYTFRFKKSSEEDWSEEMTDTTDTFLMEELEECTDYDFELRTVCAFDTSAYKRLTFTTHCINSTDVFRIEGLDVLTYPNPVGDRLSIRMDATHSMDLRIRLYHLTGQLVYHRDQTTLPGTSDLTISGLDRLPAGMYVLEISNGEGHIARKLVKQ